MPFEDFTTYDETDPNADISIDDAVTITVTSMRMDADGYVSDSKGANHFNDDFAHKIKVTCDDVDEQKDFPIGFFWGLFNTAGSEADAGDGLDAGFQWYDGLGANNIRVLIRESDAGVGANQDNWDGGTQATNYWCLIERDSLNDIFTCKIYTDQFITLVDTLTIDPLNNDDDYEYVEPAFSFDGTIFGFYGARWISFTVEDLDLQEAAALSIPVAMHHYGHHISKIIRG